ncbi:hypothetical protein V6R86_01550 [Sphingomonas kaistensis]|uniref:Uncharacterized protein n=1 Tax=Sphingomonas kaistensis TaxID=298708 RepID=A0ABZ2G021_9SPHN
MSVSDKNANEAAAALRALDAANLRLAERMRWPLWRHASAGLLLALMLAAIALQPSPLGFALFGVAMLLTLAIARDDKKRHGMFVSGYQRGRTAWVMAAVLLLFIGCVVLVLSLPARSLDEIRLWLTMLALFVATTGLSLVWERVYRAEIQRKLS